MCGILGWFSQETQTDALKKAMRRLYLRGPDRSASWSNEDKCVGMAHSRLAINDLSLNADQPMQSHGLVMVCNGEIYNAPELRIELEEKGYVFHSKSDNEVILHGYDYWREDVLTHLEGMFAFGIWEEEKKEFFLARDIIGIKPLSYCHQGNSFVFASDIGAILPFIGEEGKRINPLSMAYVLSIGYVPAPLTIWEGVKKLRPGHFLKWRIGGIPEIECYWSPPTQINHNLKKEHFPGIFNKNVQKHGLSDVPMGLFLSGGLDSTAVAVAAKENNLSLDAFSLHFVENLEEKKEMSFAQETATSLGYQHKKITMESPDIELLLQETVKAYDEPQAYGGLLPYYNICKVASKNYRCVFGGDGGDEVFGGYGWYGNVSKKISFRSQIKRKIQNVMYNVFPYCSYKKRYQDFANASVLHRHAWRQFPRFVPEEVTKLLSPLRVKFNDDVMLSPFKEFYTKALPTKRALQRVDLMNFCSGSILPKVDRASMAFGLEVRVPFLSKEIIEYGLSLPVDTAEEKTTKPIVSNYLKNKVSEELLSNPKKGFSLKAAEFLDWDRIIIKIRESRLVKEKYLCDEWEVFVLKDQENRNGRIFALWMLTTWFEYWSCYGNGN